MAEEEAGTPTRERIWVTKYDHATDPPTPVEEVFVEDGVVRVMRLGPPADPSREGEA